jgi:hypothetical protein
MFCPKCGGQNPENGKFCRSCGTDLANVSQALRGALPHAQPLLDRKGRPMNYERAIAKIFTGLAFLAVTIALAFSRSAEGWWFWMLIPAFGSLGSGFAQYVQLRKAEGKSVGFTPIQPIMPIQSTMPQSSLPPPQTEWVAPDTRYKTGDLVPPSVTENTTRHLEIDSEGQTMTLPKK